MAITLADALQEVDLEPGRTYRCQVKGHWIELRVLGNSLAIAKPPSVVEEGKMDPWMELPLSLPVFRLQANLGKSPLPDPPIIPEDEEIP